MLASTAMTGLEAPTTKHELTFSIEVYVEEQECLNISEPKTKPYSYKIYQDMEMQNMKTSVSFNPSLIANGIRGDTSSIVFFQKKVSYQFKFSISIMHILLLCLTQERPFSSPSIVIHPNVVINTTSSKKRNNMYIYCLLLTYLLHAIIGGMINRGY